VDQRRERVAVGRGTRYKHGFRATGITPISKAAAHRKRPQQWQATL